MRTWIFCILTIGHVVHHVAEGSLNQTQLTTLADTLDVKVKVIDNCRYEGNRHVVTITLHNNGNTPVPASGWTMYFHSMLLVFPGIFPKNETHDLDIEHIRVGRVQADFYFLHPIAGFVEIAPDESRNYDIIVALWALSRTDFMPNWYLVSDNPDVEPRIIKSTADMSLNYVQPFNDVRQWKRFNGERYNPYTAQERFRRFAYRKDGVEQRLILPTPDSVEVQSGGAPMAFDTTWKVFSESDTFKDVVKYITETLAVTVAQSRPASKVILLRTQTPTPSPESYYLTINTSTQIITLESGDPAGMFYAFQSLRSILSGHSNQNIPTLSVKDKPRYPFRGMYLDVSRNFHDVSDVKRLMTAMAMYKMNKLHIHLGDDEGWRVEIAGLPELTEVGGNRCHDLTERKCIIPQFGSGPFANSPGSGFYTVNDYHEILREANKLHIQVIPEFDMPGHSHSAIKSMEARYHRYKDTNMTAANEYLLSDLNDTSEFLSPQYWRDNAVNPCMESTYAFIKKVMETIKAIHEPVQPLDMYHFGGDEVPTGVWVNSTICQEFMATRPEFKVAHDLKPYFAKRVAAIAAEVGLALAGWEDGFFDRNHDPIPQAEMSGVDLYTNPWNNIWEWGGGSNAYKLANAGYKVIMSQATHLYFDHPQEPDPEERGLYWATRYTDARKTLKFLPDSLYDNIDVNRNGYKLSKEGVCGEDMAKCPELQHPENIIGMQGHLWSETIRTSANIDYMVFPRMLAVAERAWHKAPFEEPSLDKAERDRLFETEWDSFAKSVGTREFKRLEELKIEYRIPPPGGRVLESGKVVVSMEYEGLIAQTSVDGGQTWADDDGTLMWSDDRTVHLRLANADKTRFGRSIQLFKEEPVPAADQRLVDYIADNIDVQLDVVDNMQKYLQVNEFVSYVNISVRLTNTGNMDIPAATWRIYFYSIFGSYDGEKMSCGLSVGHDNIVLYYLTPTDISFPGIKTGETLHCIYHNKMWSVSRNDQYPNWYVAATGMQPRLLNSTAGDDATFVGPFNTPNKWKRTREDLFDPYTPQVRYEMYSKKNTDLQRFKVVPTPVNFAMRDNAQIVFDQDTWVIVNSSILFVDETQFLADSLNMSVNSNKPADKYIEIKQSPLVNGNPEGYELDMLAAEKRITIRAHTAVGALHGVQTLLSLVETAEDTKTLPNAKITDYPRYQYRGVMLDTVRNFKTVDVVLRFIDTMSMYKLNKLHFHLSDDENWRVEIPGIPELTKIGGRRCHSDYTDTCVIPQLGSGPSNETGFGSGFYTVDEYRQILAYAKKHHIDVIPEIESPGHAVAAIAVMEERQKDIEKRRSHKNADIPESFRLFDPEYVEERVPYEKRFRDDMNPCLNSTYRFMEAVLKGLIELHRPVQPLQVFHMGGDEVTAGTWDKSPACNKLHGAGKVNSAQLLRDFVKRVGNTIALKGLVPAVWDDGVYYNGKPNDIADIPASEVYVYPWSGGTDHIHRSYQFANAGYKVVMPIATHLYFDQAQEPDPEARGLYWASRATDTAKVFSFMPDDLYSNVDKDVFGHKVDLSGLCGDVDCPSVNATTKNNILGIEATTFAETMRTEEHFHEMVFPRLLALAERAWHKASWETASDAAARNAQRLYDWEAFANNLGYKELVRLEKMGIKYLMTPPGAKLNGKTLMANTLYPGHFVEISSDNGENWRPFQTTNLEDGTHAFLLRSKSPVLGRLSRPVTLHVKVKDDSVSSANHVISCSVISLLCIIAFITQIL